MNQYNNRAAQYGHKKLKIHTKYHNKSVDINNYHDKFTIFISFRFKGGFLPLSESCRNQTINYGFKWLFMVRTGRHAFEFFTLLTPVIFP